MESVWKIDRDMNLNNWVSAWKAPRVPVMVDGSRSLMGEKEDERVLTDAEYRKGYEGATFLDLGKN